MKREIIEIDEDLCTGCGACIIACAEGALAIVDGKARLVGDIYCDGLGACLGDCPEGALTMVEREAEGFDEDAVDERLHRLEQEGHCEPASAPPEEAAPAMACGCPGSLARLLARDDSPGDGHQDAAPSKSELGHWPVKLQLLSPGTPFLRGADLVLLADCAAAAHPDLHTKVLSGRCVAMGCPKLDDLDAHISRLAAILEKAGPKSLTVMHMEVPCCHGFVYGAMEAMKRSGADIPVRRVQIGVEGDVQHEEDLA